MLRFPFRNQGTTMTQAGPSDTLVAILRGEDPLPALTDAAISTESGPSTSGLPTGILA